MKKWRAEAEKQIRDAFGGNRASGVGKPGLLEALLNNKCLIADFAWWKGQSLKEVIGQIVSTKRETMRRVDSRNPTRDYLNSRYAVSNLQAVIYGWGGLWGGAPTKEYNEYVSEVAKNVRGKTFCDFGFGIGSLIWKVAEKGLPSEGFEINGDLVDFVNWRAREFGLPIKARKADSLYPIKCNYDTIACVWVLGWSAHHPARLLRHLLKHASKRVIITWYQQGNIAERGDVVEDFVSMNASTVVPTLEMLHESTKEFGFEISKVLDISKEEELLYIVDRA